MSKNNNNEKKRSHDDVSAAPVLTLTLVLSLSQTICSFFLRLRFCDHFIGRRFFFERHKKVNARQHIQNGKSNECCLEVYAFQLLCVHTYRRRYTHSECDRFGFISTYLEVYFRTHTHTHSFVV